MKKQNPLIIIGLALLAIAVIAALYALIHYINKPAVTGIKPTVIHEGKDSAITISGKNFPDADRLEVSFSGVPGTIQQASRNQLVVLVPVSKVKPGHTGDPLGMNLFVKIGPDVIYSKSVFCELDKETAVTGFSPNYLLSGPTVTFSGKNLNMPRIKVRINNVECLKVQVSVSEITVQTPALVAGVVAVPVEVFVNSRSIYRDFGTTIKPKFILHKVDAIQLKKTVAFPKDS